MLFSRVLRGVTLLTKIALERLNQSAKALGLSTSELVLKYVPELGREVSQISPKRIIPTSEQKNIVCGFANGENILVDARSGTGKSTTLFMCADRIELGKKGLYICFNTHTAKDALARLPKNCEAKTINSLAYAQVGVLYRSRIKNFISNSFIAEYYDLSIFSAFLNEYGAASLIKETLCNFCSSNSKQILVSHVNSDVINQFSGKERKTLIENTLSYATDMWNNMIDVDSSFPVLHEFYMKLYELQEFHLDYDYILIDEVQDLTPAMLAALYRQKTQIISVGDKYQDLYQWKFKSKDNDIVIHNVIHYKLTRSWRFGNNVAYAANQELRNIGAIEDELIDEVRSKKSDNYSLMESILICRTIEGCFLESLSAELRHKKTYKYLGVLNQVKGYGKGLCDLLNSVQPSHPSLMTHRNWGEFEYWAESKATETVKDIIRLVNSISVRQFKDYVDSLDTDESGDLICTVNRCKGKEWNKVRLSNDFNDQADSKVLAVQKYVAITRSITTASF